MFKTIGIFFLLITSTCSAQLFPAEGSMICFRLIGFSYPAQAGAVKYTVQVARGNYNTDAQFEKNIVTTFQSKTNKAISEVPAFGAPYTWRVTVTTPGNKIAKTPFYHFGTIITPNVDPALSRLRIITPAKKYKNAYVLLDGARTMYNMKGEPVWFLPGTEQERNREAYPRDLKLTPQGTLTFLTGGQPYEITYNGDIRWLYHGNKPDHSIDSFHHEFTRLHNGHYMAMRFENELFPLPAYRDKIARNAADSALFYRNIHCNAIAEYDEDNHIVWHWSGFDYIKNSDLFRHYANDSAFDIKDLHENSFYFDEKNKFVYISFRNINRIIKVKYPEGNVVNTYGPLYTPGTTKMTNDLFCYQHSIRHSPNGYIYLFNNNNCRKKHIPTVLKLEEPAPGKTELKKIWEYQCTVDDPDAADTTLYFNSGGNVLELADQDMFVSMSTPFCKTFIVSPGKKVLWSAVPEKYDPVQKKWGQIVELYRASIITNSKDLENLIWTAQK